MYGGITVNGNNVPCLFLNEFGLLTDINNSCLNQLKTWSTIFLLRMHGVCIHCVCVCEAVRCVYDLAQCCENFHKLCLFVETCKFYRDHYVTSVLYISSVVFIWREKGIFRLESTSYRLVPLSLQMYYSSHSSPCVYTVLCIDIHPTNDITRFVPPFKIFEYSPFNNCW